NRRPAPSLQSTGPSWSLIRSWASPKKTAPTNSICQPNARLAARTGQQHEERQCRRSPWPHPCAAKGYADERDGAEVRSQHGDEVDHVIAQTTDSVRGLP